MIPTCTLTLCLLTTTVLAQPDNVRKKDFDQERWIWDCTNVAISDTLLLDHDSIVLQRCLLRPCTRTRSGWIRCKDETPYCAQYDSVDHWTMWFDVRRGPLTIHFVDVKCAAKLSLRNREQARKCIRIQYEDTLTCSFEKKSQTLEIMRDHAVQWRFAVVRRPEDQFLLIRK